MEPYEDDGFDQLTRDLFTSLDVDIESEMTLQQFIHYCVNDKKVLCHFISLQDSKKNYRLLFFLPIGPLQYDNMYLQQPLKPGKILPLKNVSTATLLEFQVDSYYQTTFK